MRNPSPKTFVERVEDILKQPDPFAEIANLQYTITPPVMAACEQHLQHRLEAFTRSLPTVTNPKTINVFHQLNYKKMFSTSNQNEFLTIIHDVDTDKFLTELCDLHIVLLTEFISIDFVIVKVASQVLAMGNLGRVTGGDGLVDNSAYLKLLNICHALWLMFPLSRVIREVYPTGLHVEKEGA